MILYYNGPASNHGCEAIVRATCRLLGEDLTLASFSPELDRRWGVDSAVRILDDRAQALKKPSLGWLVYALHHKLTGSEELYTRLTHRRLFSRVKKGDICLSVGGDNYCYPRTEVLAHYNRAIHAKGGRTVLWGCSVEPELIKDPAIARDLAMYDGITARETISYEALKAVNPNTVLVSDPAFLLDRVDLPLPEGWVEGKMIGVNASPLILQSGDGGLILNAYRALIEYILQNTDCSVALVPHVVLSDSDDREVLKMLLEEYRHTGRILLIGDHNCMELKGYIARCRFFIGARTHATIAAYSTCVPTLVAGYSVKSRGIARDIFGTEEGYVVPVQALETGSELADAFAALWGREEEIRQHLQRVMPAYCANAWAACAVVEELVRNRR
ncbi:MAG: polysaccharide pyruvyl transferase family protein [Oscillospiraceae bacterium]|nr:polysaccharide pyruvyl transferase family protein [Oscillospiraceae bacterium]